MSFPSWALAQGLIYAMKVADNKHMIEELADRIDVSADFNLKSQSEPFQEQFIKRILFPLGRTLMKENKSRWTQLLEAEKYGNFGKAVGQPVRGDELISGELGEVPRGRQAAQTPHSNITVRKRADDDGK